MYTHKLEIVRRAVTLALFPFQAAGRPPRIAPTNKIHSSRLPCDSNLDEKDDTRPSRFGSEKRGPPQADRPWSGPVVLRATSFADLLSDVDDDAEGPSGVRD